MSYRLLSSGAPWPERKRCCPSVRRPPAAGRTAPFRAFIACVALLGCQSPAPDPDDASAVPDTALRLDAISPLAGPSGGGIPLILRGQNIAPGAEVRVAGAIAPNAIFRSPGELRVTLPAGPGVIGPVPIELRNPDGQTTIRPELFAYGSLLEKPLGGQPASLASADFDGDGQYDLATLSLWDDSVTVLLNTGGGRFERQLRLPLGEHIEETASLAAVDLDGDGKSDLVVSQSARLFHNLGGGRFAAPVPLQAGVASQFVTVGDYDGDGRPDLALLNAHSSTGWILLNQGSLRFSTPIALTLGPIVYGEAVAAGDFDGDGKDDLAVAADGGVTIATSVARTPGVTKLIALPGHPVSVSAGELNGDGLLDLAVTTNFTRDIQVLAGDGTGGFSVIASLPVGDNPSHVTIGDLNGDRTPDLVVANRWSASLSVLPGRGGGSFGPGASLPVGAQPVRTVMADLDGDGRPDLASVNYVGASISVVLSGDHGSVGPTLSFPVRGASSAVFTQDLDGDGYGDVVARSIAASINVLFSDKMGWFTGADYPRPVADAEIVGVGDMDGDGRPDLIARSPGLMHVLPNQGGGSFGSSVSSPAGGTLFGFVTADFNRDGNLDLVALQYDRVEYDALLLLGTGKATFSPPVRVATAGEAQAMAAADFNGDGATDLAITYQNNTVVGILLGTGTGSFGPSRQVELGARGPLGITAADINGDGWMDLAVPLSASATSNGLGLLSVLLGRGDGTFATPTLYLTGVSPSSVAVGDLNGDRIPDLAVANLLGASVTIFLGKSGGALEQLESVQVNGNPLEVKLLDVNGDGKLDLILPSQLTDNLSILLNRF